MTGYGSGVPRSSARALMVDQDDRVLLCRHDLRATGGPIVWAAPGGGLEPGETLLAALRRELAEEVGFVLEGEPPHVWHQEAADVVNDYFLVRTAAFVPRGTLSREALAAEYIAGLRWWSLAELAGYRGEEVFSPRELARHLGVLLSGGVAGPPLQLGL